MDAHTTHVKNSSDEKLLELAKLNLVTSQMRVVLAEVEKRGLSTEESK